MSHQPHKPFDRGRKTGLALAALGALLAPAAAQAADARKAGRERPDREPAAAWTTTIDVDLSARKLGLPPRTSAPRLARAALKHEAKRLGVERSLSRLRLARDLRTPARGGARAIRQLRFQQTAGPLRVIWSQIDVTIAARKVRTINATVVPVKREAAASKRRVSRKRALRIARDAVAGPDEALRPLPIAYAGAPTTDRAAKPRTARRAWVVEVYPTARPDDEDDPPGLCVIVDAGTGKVIARWWGTAARPDSGPDARAADADAANGSTAHASATQSSSGGLRWLSVFDGTTSVDPPRPIYSRFLVEGDPRVSRWPEWEEGILSGITRTAEMDAMTANARNVVRTVCDLRNYCGARGFSAAGNDKRAWAIVGNTNEDDSHIERSSLSVFIADEDVMGVQGDPNLPANDILAHEMGHIMNLTYSNADFSENVEVKSINEGLADMFSYEYDRFDAQHGEDRAIGASRDFQTPGRFSKGGQPYPAHMDHYDLTPPGGSGHFNSTILSHAYYLFVQRVGHTKAGAVLHHVPQRLSPRPTFAEVARSFNQTAQVLYGGTTAAQAVGAFSEVGLAPATPQEPDCGPLAC
jgi:Thermolysin metallopeptidase, alpha-helical domain